MHSEPYPKYILRNIVISGTSVAGGGNLPVGGSTGQYLRKISSTDFDTEWGTLTVANVTDLTASATELNYTDGVTSSIQTQLNTKLGTTLASANIIVGNVSNVATAVAMTGDIAITNTGVTSIGSGVIVNADVNASAAVAYSKLAALTVSRALVSDGSGFVSAATTTATEIGYVNGVTSAIQTQLNAKLTNVLTSANVFVGNGSNVATGVAISGDVTISNAGVVAIAGGVIVNADVNASAAIAVSKLAAVTASRALASDASGFITPSATTSTELGYVSGVTSAIQTQLDNEIATQTVNSIVKSPTVAEDGYAITWDDVAGEYTLSDPIIQGLTAGGAINTFLYKVSGTNYDAAWRLLLQSDISDVTASAAEVNILDGATLTTTELNYVDGVTSNIQTQLDGKQSSSLAQNAMWVGNASNIATQLSPGTSGYVLTSVSGVPQWQPTPTVGHTIENSGTPLTHRANLNFKNGLTAADNSPDTDIKIGGTLTENTDINGAFHFKFGDSVNLTSFVAKAEDITLMSTAVSGSSSVRFNDGLGIANQIFVEGDGVGVELTAGKTFVAAADYSADFVSLSYIHKGYADVTYAPISGSTNYWRLSNGGTLTGANTITGTTSNTLKYIFNSLDVTSTNGAGHWLSNTTAAAPAAQQISPSTVWEGQGWKTDATAASESVKFLADVLPVQGAANPTGTWRLRSSINNAAYDTILTISSTGFIFCDSGATFNNSVDQIGTNNGFQNSGALTNNGTYHFISNGAISGGNLNVCFLAENVINSAAGTVNIFDSEQTITSVTNLTGFKHNPVNPSNVSGTHLAFHGVTGSMLLGDTNKSANTGEKVIVLSNASTNATAAQTNGIVIHSKDSSDGSANATLALYLEQAPEATATFTQTHRLKVWINGVEYFLSLDSV